MAEAFLDRQPLLQPTYGFKTNVYAYAKRGLRQGEKLDGVVPNQDSYGTLLIPTTIALVKGAPNGENGKRLIDFLLDPAIEKELIAGRYLAYSTRDAEKHVKAMDVDYTQVAREMRKAVEVALGILQDRGGK